MLNAISQLLVFSLLLQNTNANGVPHFSPLPDEDIYNNYMLASGLAKSRVMANRLQHISDDSNCSAIHNDFMLIMNENSLTSSPGYPNFGVDRSSFITRCLDQATQIFHSTGRPHLAGYQEWQRNACGRVYDGLINQECPTNITLLYTAYGVDDLAEVFGALTHERPDHMTNLDMHCGNSTRSGVQ